MPRICFVALNAYPAIEPRAGGGFGGIETRSWMFARALARMPDMHIQFVVRHGKPLLHDRYDGVQLVLMRDRLYRVRDSLVSRLSRTSRFPFVMLRRPRLSDAVNLPLLAAAKLLRPRRDPRTPDPFFANIAADCFVTFGVQSGSASVIASAHATGRPCVLVLGSDGDLDERYVAGSDYVSVYRDRGDVCRWVLDNADAIVCQTAAQEQLLQSRFHRTGTVIRNPIDLEQWDALSSRPPDAAIAGGLNRYALWVGRADGEHKRPQLLPPLAQQCPEVPFLAIMNPRDDVVEAEVRAAAPANLRIVERAAFEAMPALMKNAAVLVNTSSLEGFPNTFLQAMASGTPVASLVVEEEFLMRTSAGMCARGDLAELATAIREAAGGTPRGFDASFARSFVEREHGLRDRAAELADVLQSVAFQSGKPAT